MADVSANIRDTELREKREAHPALYLQSLSLHLSECLVSVSLPLSISLSLSISEMMPIFCAFLLSSHLIVRDSPSVYTAPKLFLDLFKEYEQRVYEAGTHALHIGCPHSIPGTT